jgi:hypothetical protein
VTQLTVLMLLAFGSLVTLLLALWLTLTVRDRVRRAQDATERVEVPPRPRADLTNDTVRGARAPRKHPPADAGVAGAGRDASVRVRPRPEGRPGEDPFDRFLERGRRDDF